MTKYAGLFFMILCSVCFFTWIHNALISEDSTVQVINRGNYYEVIIDYTSGISHYDMGVLLGQKIQQAKPDFEQLFDSYIAEITDDQSVYNTMIDRTADIKPQIPQEYQDEIDGMASQLSGGNTNSMGDNKLSKDELYVMQLITDVYRATQCSGISVYGSRSATGNTITARLLDWYDGANHQLAQVQSVTTIHNGSKTIYSIGYLGYLGIITGFNDDGVFAGILDCPTGTAYSSAGKNSYTTDLRYALENYSTLTEVAGYLTDPARNYAYNHLILLSDDLTSKVLENNFSGTGTNIRRSLRSDSSALNSGITWGYTNAVATVNSFLLLGNHDNHTGNSINTNRWASLKTQLQNYGESITADELRLIASFDNNDGPGSQSGGDIYNSGNQQIVLFQPDDLYLEVAFKPRSGILPADPIFEFIPIVTLTSVKNPKTPESFVLEQNYPNPFNPKTVIRYSVPAVGTSFMKSVKLKIYDLLGREVATLVDGILPAGEHTVEWNAQNFPSGMYFYRLQTQQQTGGQTSSFTETKKMLLVK